MAEHITRDRHEVSSFFLLSSEKRSSNLGQSLMSNLSLKYQHPYPGPCGLEVDLSRVYKDTLKLTEFVVGLALHVIPNFVI